MGTPANKRPFQTGMFLDKIPYVKIGTGPKSVVILPGVSESLRNPMKAPEYIRDTYTRFFSEDYCIYVLGCY